MNRWRTKLLILGLVTSAGITSLVLFLGVQIFFLEPNWISVRTVKIPDSRLAKSLGGIKVIQISDLHLDESYGFLEEELVKRINRIHPDIILVTGDIFDSPKALPVAVKLFSQLHPRLWAYGVLGNSDLTFHPPGPWQKNLQRAGLSLIGGQVLRMDLNDGGGEFYLAGIDFPGYGVKPRSAEFKRLFEKIPSGKPAIFLAYSPEITQICAQEGINLVLSGDSHGGQIGVPGMDRIFTRLGRSSYIRGRYKIDNTYLYVNRGIATKGFPLRFLCPPEVTIFEFVNPDTDNDV